MAWILLAIGTAFLPAQGPPSRRDALETLVREADTVAPEFSADILIRTAQAAADVDRAWARDLLDEAFRRAYSAQAPYRRTSAPLPVDTRQHADALAADTPIDALSLQLRAVQLMRTLDPPHARELFESIALSIDPASCDTPLSPSVDDYYTALAAVARTTFPSTPEGRADALNFFELYLWRARLPSEIPAAAFAVARMRRTADEAAYFERALAVVLEAAAADARGFSNAGLEAVTRVVDLNLADRGFGIDGSFLTEALRKYLLAQFRQRCDDSVAEGSIIGAFNAVLSRTTTDSNVRPLAPADLRGAKLQGRMRIDPLWQTPESRSLHQDALELRGPADKPLPLRTRSTRDWLVKAERHLVGVDQWTGVHEPLASDYFYEKGVLYIGLLDLVPRGTLRSRVFRSFADFLRRTDGHERRQLWFAVATRLLERTKSDDRAQLLPILESSADAVLVLYAHASTVVDMKRETPSSIGVAAAR